MNIGLIVGIGPAATDYYYRLIIAEMAKSGAPLDLTMAHADAPTMLRNQVANNVAAQVAIYTALTRKLKAAEAQYVAVTSVAGHFCREAFAKVSPLPVIDLIDTVKTEVAARGYKRVGLIGTRVVMETRFYGSLPDVEVVVPAGDRLARVHDAYVSMAMRGAVSAAERDVFFEAGRDMTARQGADVILLAGTDLALAFTDHAPGFSVLDCAACHVQAIVKTARGAG